MWPESSWIDASAVATAASREVTDPDGSLFREFLCPWLASVRIEEAMANPPPGEGPPSKGKGRARAQWADVTGEADWTVAGAYRGAALSRQSTPAKEVLPPRG